jgi:hypothetical protein
MPRLSFSAHFLPGVPGPFEFLDIDLNEDIEIFIDPFLIANNRRDPFVRRVSDQLTHFFTRLNRTFIQPNDKVNGLPFLSHLHEPNEYHLGYSDANKGKAISREKADDVFNALRRNRFARAGVGVTNEAHNVLLLVRGIGQDNMSDTIANVCRNLFSEFTLEVCRRRGVPIIPTQIEFYNRGTSGWSTQTIELPQYRGKKIILIPSNIASGNRAYTSHYNWFIAANHISKELLEGRRTTRPNPQMLRSLKNGTQKAIIKEIYKTYRKPKEDLIDFALEFQGSLDEFLAYVKEHYPAVDISNYL